MDLLNRQIRISTYFRVIIGLTLVTMIVFVLLENAKVSHITRSLNDYMDDLKDQIFMSTYDHLKKGNMELFTRQLQDIGTYHGIKEFSLLNPEGVVRYSSDPALKESRDSAVPQIKEPTGISSGNVNIFYFPVVTVEYCTRCHPTWQKDSVNSCYKLVISRKATIDIQRLSRYYNLFIVAGGLVFLACIFLIFEVIERRKSEAQMLLSASMFDNTIEGIAITNHRNIIQKVNPAFTTITSFSAAEAIGQSIQILNPEGAETATYRSMREELHRDGQWRGELWNRRKSGETYPVWLSITAVKNLQGQITNYVSLFHDITEIKQTQDRLKHQAYHDALTGLPNRQLFNDRLDMAIAYAHRHQEKVALIFIDLDNFKNINDSAGHHVGDLFLKEVAKRLSLCCREGDTIARFGGDEFTMILQDVHNEGTATHVAKRILDALAEPFQILEHELFTNASIGITLYPQDGKTGEILTKNADMAMYRAKAQGKGTYVLYTESINTSVLRRIELENGLRRALLQNEFRLYFQPKVDIRNGRITGSEALLRWQRDTGEMVAPDEFIPLAEETELIFPLGEWVLRQACERTRQWQEAGFSDLSVAVNLSARQFQDKALANRIERILGESGLHPSKLQLELTESTVMRNAETAARTMNQLRQMGVSLALDDFGTGYSSLGYLQRFPLHTLKIDRTFVRDLFASERDQAMARAILSLCRDMGLNVVAEGIENEDQLAFMKKHGCEEYQGFLFSPPLPAEEFLTLLQTTEKAG